MPLTTIETIQHDMSELKESVDELIILVKEMNKGLYGDPKNDHIGVIERQRMMMEDIKVLNIEIAMIKHKNDEQDISIKAKDSLRSSAAAWGKRIVDIAITIIVMYAIMKGIVDADALLR